MITPESARGPFVPVASQGRGRAETLPLFAHTPYKKGASVRPKRSF